MFSKTSIATIQREGILHEYEQHVRNGNTEKARAIRSANPDLVTYFDDADSRITATI